MNASIQKVFNKSMLKKKKLLLIQNKEEENIVISKKLFKKQNKFLINNNVYIQASDAKIKRNKTMNLFNNKSLKCLWDCSQMKYDREIFPCSRSRCILHNNITFQINKKYKIGNNKPMLLFKPFPHLMNTSYSTKTHLNFYRNASSCQLHFPYFNNNSIVKMKPKAFIYD